MVHNDSDLVVQLKMPAVAVIDVWSSAHSNVRAADDTVATLVRDIVFTEEHVRVSDLVQLALIIRHGGALKGEDLRLDMPHDQQRLIVCGLIQAKMGKERLAQAPIYGETGNRQGRPEKTHKKRDSSGSPKAPER